MTAGKRSLVARDFGPVLGLFAAFIAAGLGVAVAYLVYLDGLWGHRLQIDMMGVEPQIVNDLPFLFTIIGWLLFGAAGFLMSSIFLNGSWDRPVIGLLVFSLFADAVPGLYQGSLLAIALILFARGIRHRDLPFVFTPLVFPLGLILISYATTLLYSGKIANMIPDLVFRSSYMSLIVLLPMIIRTRRHLEILLHYMIWAAVITSTVALAQFVLSAGLGRPITFARPEFNKVSTPLGTFVRATGLMLHPNHMANATCAVAVLVLYFATRPKRLIRPATRILYFVVYVYLGMSVIVTFSRSGWLALGVCSIMVPFLRWPRYTPFLLVTLGTIGFVGLETGILKAVYEQVKGFNQASADFRWHIDQLAIQGFSDSPWIGQGVGGMVHYFNAYNLQVHNSYLQVLSEMGLIGVFSFGSLGLLLLVRVSERLFRARHRIDRDWIIGLALCTGITLVQSLFAMFLWIKFWWALLALIETAALISRRQTSEEEPPDIVFLQAPGVHPVLAHGS